MNVFIFHRDFRIIDNLGLYVFDKIKSKNKVLVFFLTELQTKENKLFNHFSFNFMMNCLKELNHSVDINIIKCKSELEGIKYLHKKYNIETIHTNKDISKFSIDRSSEIKKWSLKNSISYFEYQDYLLFKPKNLLKSNNDFYKVFTPFWKNILNNHANKIPIPLKNKLESVYKLIHNKYSFYKSSIVLRETFAPYKRKEIINNFNNLDLNYSEKRDFLDSNYTTLASAAIKYGVISIREAVYFANKKFNNELNNPLTRQIIWREFYYHLYYHLTTKNKWLFGSNQKNIFNNMPWNKDKYLFKKWSDGETGFEIIDAAMNQLNTTGYMHNRARLIVGSFLTKNLLIDWKWGEEYFAIKLEDYDPIINQFSWQWIAGSGSDAAPFYRIFNPEIQQEKFDSKKIYINKYLKSSHMKILDLKESRKKALEIYKYLVNQKK